MSMTQPHPTLKTDSPQQCLEHLLACVNAAVHDHQPLHQIERDIWTQLLQLGHQLLAQVFAQCGTGDLGATVQLPDGRYLDRLPELHARRYVSIFGPFVPAGTPTAAAKGRRSTSCRWTIACNCRPAPSPTYCKTGTRRCVRRMPLVR